MLGARERLAEGGKLFGRHQKLRPRQLAIARMQGGHAADVAGNGDIASLRRRLVEELQVFELVRLDVIDDALPAAAEGGANRIGDGEGEIERDCGTGG